MSTDSSQQDYAVEYPDKAYSLFVPEWRAEESLASMRAMLVAGPVGVTHVDDDDDTDD